MTIELRKTSKEAGPKLAIEGFGVDQLWSQITHHTERVNQQAINNLNALVGSEDFLRGLDELSEVESETTE